MDSSKVSRYNVRSNVDINITPTTLLNVGIGGYLQTRNGPLQILMLMFYRASQIPPYASTHLFERSPRILKENRGRTIKGLKMES